MKQQNRTLRIIGGKWRGRKVSFSDTDQLRPTGDRIRETLFNWLMAEINGARCLDLFSGSGILAIEALSRGAAHVTLIEQHNPSADNIAAQLSELGAERSEYQILSVDAWQWLRQQGDEEQFDIIFVDPPFDDKAEAAICTELANRGLAANLVYLESASPLTDIPLPNEWELHRSKRAGDVYFGLFDCTHEAN